MSHVQRPRQGSDEHLLSQVKTDVILCEIVDADESNHDFSDTNSFDDSSHPGEDGLPEQLSHNGPIETLSRLSQLIDQEADKIYSALCIMRNAETKEVLLDAYNDLAQGRDSLNALLRRDYPCLPFIELDQVIPLSRRRRRKQRTPRWMEWQQLEQVAYAFQSDIKTVQWYLTHIEPLHPLEWYEVPERFWRWLIVHRCRRVKRARFLRAVNNLLIATGDLKAYLNSCIEPYLLHFQQCQKYLEQSTFE